MPLKPGKKNVGKNIKELESTGKYGPKQAIAIALDVARKGGAKIQKKKKWLFHVEHVKHIDAQTN